MRKFLQIRFKAYYPIAAAEMKKDNIENAVSIVLAPHYSTFSTEVYNRRAKKAAEELDVPQIFSINEWYQEERFIRYWSEEISKILNNYEGRRTVKNCFNLFCSSFIGKHFKS